MSYSMSRIYSALRRRGAREWHSHRIRRSQPYASIVDVAVRPDEVLPPPENSAFCGHRAYELLKKQCEFGARYPGSAAHRATRDFLVNQLSRFADTVGVQNWSQRIDYGPGQGSTFPLTNIFARWNGNFENGNSKGNSSTIQPHLMLCAHWDTRPVADHDPDPAKRSLPVPGANDGASGVAVLLEMARVLQIRRPAKPVMMTLWDGEDTGEYYYGSRLYAKFCHRTEFTRWRPEKAVLLDMVGGKDFLCSEEMNSRDLAPALWNDIAAAFKRSGHHQRFCGSQYRISDDHIWLNRASIPTILLIDYSYPHWHTTQDTPDKCDPLSLQVIGDVLTEFLYNCQSPARTQL